MHSMPYSCLEMLKVIYLDFNNTALSDMASSLKFKYEYPILRKFIHNFKSDLIEHKNLIQ
jgi:hypothetical protein